MQLMFTIPLLDYIEAKRGRINAYNYSPDDKFGWPALFFPATTPLTFTESTT